MSIQVLIFWIAKKFTFTLQINFQNIKKKLGNLLLDPF